MKLRLAAALVSGLMVLAPMVAEAQSMDINTIVSGIGGSEFLHDAGNVDQASSIRVVRLSTLAGASQFTDRVTRVVADKQQDLHYLWRGLANNAQAPSVISSSGVQLQQIISLDLSSDGAAVLYADDLGTNP